MSHALMKERARVLTAPAGTDPRQYYASLAGSEPDMSVAQIYGKALAQLMGGDAAGTIPTFERLRSGHPEVMQFHTALGQAQLAAGQVKAAVDTLEHARELAPRNVPVTLSYAEALLRASRPKKAHEILLDLFNNVPPTQEQIRVTAIAANAAGDVADVQMDIKVEGVTREVMQQALEQAKRGRLHILSKMNEAIPKPRSSVSQYAPVITIIQIKPEKVRLLIGPGGKIIKEISNSTNSRIDVDDAGRVVVASPDAEHAKLATSMVNKITQDAEVGRLYMGKVRKIMDFGAFVEIFPGTDGLIHISQLDKERVNKVTDILQEGDEVLVKVLEIDKSGRIALSRKAALGERLSDVS